MVDDGRRFLDRSTEKFDAIIIDPPPPIEAAGSSLLYSREFYQLVKQHLAPGGILQQWFFTGDNADKAAATRALTEIFPYVRVYALGLRQHGISLSCQHAANPGANGGGDAGAHAPRCRDRHDGVGSGEGAVDQFNLMLSQETSPQALIALSPNTPAMDDNLPINEYYWLRSSYPGLVARLR